MLEIPAIIVYPRTDISLFKMVTIGLEGIVDGFALAFVDNDKVIGKYEDVC
jgi:hypothetical protein